MEEFMPFGKKGLQNTKKGFTLVEVMIAMAISTVVFGSIFAAYDSQQKLYITQEQVAGMQQNLRLGMYFMERDLRKAGLEEPMANGTKSGLFGVTDIRYRNINDNVAAPGVGFSSLQFSFDENNSHTLGANETVTYSVFDGDGDGNFDLALNDGTGRQMMAENIEALAFAYAYDNNADGQLDFRDFNGNGQLDPAGGDYIVWAIDSDNNNNLDFDLNTNQDVDANQNGLLDWRDLNTNGDNVIDINDDIDGDGAFGVGDVGASALPGGGTVPLASIRAVRIWLLARTDRAHEERSVDTAGINGNDPYFLGDRAIIPALDPNIPDDFKRKVLTTIIFCRNMGS